MYAAMYANKWCDLNKNSSKPFQSSLKKIFRFAPYFLVGVAALLKFVNVTYPDLVLHRSTVHPDFDHVRPSGGKCGSFARTEKQNRRSPQVLRIESMRSPLL